MSGQPYVEIYTDGACSPNPGLGGWGAVLVSPAHDHVREISGAEPDTTNNRMELTAVVEGLRALKRPCRVRVTTDSRYVANAFTQGWLAGWKRKGWKTANKDPVKNRDLWESLDSLVQQHQVEWQWVKGHAGHPRNERADALAVAAREALR
ncbi:MAG: ribonuclease HI [Deltaproteobacteria bacterium]|nr:MAG: ribonuclease HI [Deltaproteobacteria bacterium]